MAKTINLNDYKKMQLGDRQMYIDENNVVVAEKYFARYWLFYPAATSIKVVEEEDGTVRIIIDEPSS